jgi:hypothetical protein
MNKRLNLSHLGGLPYTQGDLIWLQASYNGAFAAMSNFIGDKVIITGMIEAGGEVSAGWISLAGELVPFASGAIGTGEFIIEQTAVTRNFSDGSTYDIRVERIAKFSAGGPNQYTDLVRLATLKLDMPKKGEIKMINCNNAYIAANFDVSGLGINERLGWARCNGINGTINMEGIFPVGFNSADADYDEVGKTGGSKTHTLTVDQIPSHRHQISTTGNQAGVDPGRAIQRSSTNGDAYSNGGGVQPYLEATGGGLPHENRPPFKTLLFIEKL